MDPIVTDDEQVNAIKESVEGIVRVSGDGLRTHDFRIVTGPTHTNLIFDIEVPFEDKRSNKEIVAQIENKIKELNGTYFAVISVDRV